MTMDDRRTDQKSAKSDRDRRLAEALRANLRRRKAAKPSSSGKEAAAGADLPDNDSATD